ncbi:hypothetical protein LTR70_004850 [Exophiala xenobiotica]|uniref:Uncharacterized protein n=1 Tax=Lithohypha guttulata TaxID=1690604 RepID=A0ABR0KBT6_9EURO|nr:hypothetical protein LTR24_004468 [Lithohypha guttulata]KAK5319805.1 hypothetical protein LTR70_004850 [Exophiala xenobiotica]
MPGLPKLLGGLRSWLPNDQYAYGMVGDDGQRQQGSPSVKSRLKNVLALFISSQIKFKALFVVVASLFIYLLSFHSWPGGAEIVAAPILNVSYYHLLIPASEGNANLCKTLFSAAALGYPTPRLINWQRKFDDPNLIFGGSHIAKIEGVLNILRQLEPASDKELVSIIDGYDVWFQLRPEVLIGRYHEINDRANRRIRVRLGSRLVESQNISQTVVFSSQKKCWPASEDDPACFAVPQSELADDVYGPRTDQDIGDEKNPFVKMRQRYLNSGTVIGPVEDVRAIYERALDKLSFGANIGSDQGIFADILGEQEYQREVLRAQNLTRWQIMRAWLLRTFLRITDVQDDVTWPHPTRHRMDAEALGDKRYEFHLGIDYQSELSQPTVFSEDDLAWIKHNDQIQISEKSTSAGIPGPPRLKGLPRDIAKSRPPFWAPDIDSANRFPAEGSWENMSTYTNLWTGITPVAIHHNAHRDGLKGRIQTFWNETWFFPHLRELLHARASAVRAPHAVVFVPGVEQDSIQEWWGPIDEKGGVNVDGNWR